MPKAYRDLQDEITTLRQELAEARALHAGAVDGGLSQGYELVGTEFELAALRQELEQLRTETALIRLVAIKARAWVWADRNGRPQGAAARSDVRRVARTELKAAVDAWKQGGHG